MNTKNLFNSNSRIFDAIIIGGGPAGLSCALELAYCKVSCLLIDKGGTVGGQLLQVGAIENFAGGYFKDGATLARSMSDLCDKKVINLLLGHSVDSIELKSDPKTVTVDKEKYQARTIVLATGVRLKTLEVPGLSLVAEDVLYRDQAPPAQFADLRVGVVGGGDNAVDKAVQLAQKAAQVYVINRSDHWRCRQDLIRAARDNPRIELLENSVLESLSGVGKLRSACLVDKISGRIRNLSLDKLFVKIGYAPNTELVKNLIELDQQGYIRVDAGGATSVSGVFAAGDVVAGVVPRIATACGAGSTAAAMIQLHVGKRERSELVLPEV